MTIGETSFVHKARGLSVVDINAAARLRFDQCCKPAADGCVTWGGHFTQKGQPQHYVGSTFGLVSARRVAGAIAWGSVPARSLVSASCGRRDCVSAGHLVLRCTNDVREEPDGTVRALNRGFEIVVEAVDGDLLLGPTWSAYRSRGGMRYAKRNPQRALGETQSLLLHRVIGARLAGRPLLDVEVVDHKNGNGLDCRRVNLRIVTRAVNMQNRARHDSRNQTGYRGVIHSGTGRFIAQATQAKRHVYLGTFDTAEEAALVAHEWRIANMPGYIAENALCG